MDAIGGGVLVAVAAALWIAYLLPTWLRRRQYLATERNAVRLQQTLRILAETAETPEAVTVEATAREVVAQQRILAEQAETARLEAEAAEQRAIAERLHAAELAAAARAEAEAAAVQAAVAADAPAPAWSEEGAERAPAGAAARRRARRRLRRARALCTLVMLVSLIVAIVGLVGLAAGGSAVPGLLGAAGVAGGLTGTVVLSRRRVSAPSVAVAAPVAEAPPFEPFEFAEPAPVAEAVDEGWTPNALPKALHLSRGTIAAAAMASIEAAEQLRKASLDAELAERAAALAPAVPTIAARQQAPAARVGRPVGDEPVAETPANPYARMGVVEAAEPGFESLDAVLRRRREAV
ncbi:hypothetical protein ABIQ69_05345 [Agromyces sp. G08B096]|uniref:Large exoprotein n=1 Tax=Agromyces sp. G08B096 TaxID=3156399 RepID=A0AAU7WBI9_9MICO